MQQTSSDRIRELDSYPIHLRLMPRYGDMDLQHHVNNVSIARYFEESRLSLHREVKLLAPLAFTSMVLAHVDIDYLLEVAYPDEVVLATGVGRIGSASFDQVGALFQHGECKAVSRATTVRRNPDRSGSQALDDHERRALLARRVVGYEK